MAAACIEFSNIRANLRDAPIEPSWIIDGAPRARNALLSQSPDGTQSTVLWDCAPGRFMWHYDAEETIHFLEGSVVLDDGDGPRLYGPGDVLFIPAGAVVHWTVETHVRKLAFLRRGLPKPLEIAVNLLRRLKRSAKTSQMPALGSIKSETALAGM
jgi:uncharacterized cupin superfamily protein